MQEKESFFDSAKRFIRNVVEVENLASPDFTYDPDRKNTEGSQPDGSYIIGKEAVQFAIASAQAFRESLGKEEAEKTQTPIGLSVSYIKKHFPEALKDAKYDE